MLCQLTGGLAALPACFIAQVIAVDLEPITERTAAGKSYALRMLLDRLLAAADKVREGGLGRLIIQIQTSTPSP